MQLVFYHYLATDADDTNTELSTEIQRSGTSLATPAFPLQSQGSTRSTTSYYVNEGLGPMYYSSVNSGDHGNVLSLEYDYTFLPMLVQFS